jgi:hypothetical protein
MPFRTHGHTDRVIEWLFASMMLSWGLYLWLPFPTFDAPQYAILKAIASEDVWAVWSVCIGSIRLAALVINGHIRQTPVIRSVCAILGLIWWMVLAYLFLVAPGNPPAAAVWFPIFAVFEAYSALRTGADACVSGALRRTYSMVQ